MQYDFFTRTFEPVEDDKESEKDITEIKPPEGEEGEPSPAGAEEGRAEGDVEEGRVRARREEDLKEVCYLLSRCCSVNLLACFFTGSYILF